MEHYNVEYEGLDGTMVMFPSKVNHHVEPQISNKERITVAFNISEILQKPLVPIKIH